MSHPKHVQAIANASELAQLKVDISLVAYLESEGWVRDNDKSTRQVAFLRHANGEKIVVRRGNCGYDTWAEVPGYAQKGSIVDFLQRQGLSLDEARVRLREFSGKPDFSSIKSNPAPVDSEPDRKKVKAVWEAAHWTPEPRYLLFRHIPPSILADWRFRDCWREASNGDVIFRHFDKRGPCGYERRNGDLKAFGSRTKKGLWCSRNVKTCKRLVITEGPVDCLSFHALRVDQSDQAWPLGYVAFGGGMGNQQRDLLAYVMRQVAERGASIIIGTDNDPAGHEYAATIAKLAPLSVERITPTGGDWNDDLCAREGGSWS